MNKILKDYIEETLLEYIEKGIEDEWQSGSMIMDINLDGIVNDEDKDLVLNKIINIYCSNLVKTSFYEQNKFNLSIENLIKQIKNDYKNVLEDVKSEMK